MSGEDVARVAPTDTSATQTSRKRPGLDALAEDVFGLNIRGLKTIWHLIVDPKKVFTAARDADWNHQYTPSIRLYFSILAVIAFFQFVWAGEHSYTREAFISIFEQLREQEVFGALDPTAAANEAIELFVLISPFVVGGFMLITSLCVFIWGKGTNLTTRIRLFFAALIPYTFVSLFLSTATSYANTDQTALVAIAAFGTMVIVNWGTIYRGLSGFQSGAHRFWKATLFTFTVVFATIVSGTFTQIAVGIWTGAMIVRADQDQSSTGEVLTEPPHDPDEAVESAPRGKLARPQSNDT